MSSLSKNYVKETCKLGQGADCCRYLACDQTGMICAKLDPMLASMIDERTDMTAKGDNCEGVS